MKNNRSVFIFILIIVFVIGGAGFLYNHLTKDLQMNPFVINENSSKNELSQAGNSDEESLEPNSLADDTATKEQELESAPDFTVYDASGNEVKLSDFLGKPVVLNFWASWCGPCKSEMPGFDNLYQKYGDQVQFMMVNLTDGASETVESASSFISDNGYTFPVFYDSDSNGAYTYGISSIPTTFLINKKGELSAYAMGAISEEALENGIEMILE